MQDVDRIQLRAEIDHLLEEGFLTLQGEEYPVLRLTERASEVLFHGRRVTLRQRRPTAAERTASARKGAKAMPGPVDDGLFQALRALRFQLAQKESVPAYVVFSNATLTDMAARRPATPEEFLQVSGVGEAKARKYAKPFLAEIAAWRAGERGDRSLP